MEKQINEKKALENWYVPPLLDKPVKGVFIMRYSFEFKMKWVELYRQGTWAETPEKVKQKSFIRKIDICSTDFKWKNSYRSFFFRRN